MKACASLDPDQTSRLLALTEIICRLALVRGADIVRWRLIDLAELIPVENIWQFMRDNWLSNRVFKSYDDILDLMFVALVFIHNLVSEEQPP